jgi:hypothetical protein
MLVHLLVTLAAMSSAMLLDSVFLYALLAKKELVWEGS